MKKIAFILFLLSLYAPALFRAQDERPRFSKDSSSVSNTSMVTDSMKIISTAEPDSAVVSKPAPPADSVAKRTTYTKDSVQRAAAAKKKLYSRPRRAAIMSAVIPGLGQAYNKKYWKMPIIYGGLGVFTYIFVTNNKQYNYYRKNLKAAYDNDSNTVNTSGYDGAQLETLKVQYRKTRDVGIIGISLIYIFNVIDANVDGHLKTFDVSDELSLHVDPWQSINRNGPFGFRTATGLSVTLSFR